MKNAVFQTQRAFSEISRQAELGRMQLSSIAFGTDDGSSGPGGSQHGLGYQLWVLSSSWKPRARILTALSAVGKQYSFICHSTKRPEVNSIGT